MLLATFLAALATVALGASTQILLRKLLPHSQSASKTLITAAMIFSIGQDDSNFSSRVQFEFSQALASDKHLAAGHG